MKELSGRRVMLIALGVIMIIVLSVAITYYYVDKNDPTKSLYYYPSTKTEMIDENGNKYTVENIFPAYNNYNFFHEKRDVNYKTLHDMVGTVFNINTFREGYEFSIIKYPDNDRSLQYGISRYYIYDIMSDLEPTSIIYVDSNNIVVGVTSPYLLNGEFKDITLSGANFSEVTRLEAFILSKYDKQFMQLYQNIYLLFAKESKSKEDIYSVSIHSDKKIMSLSNLIDFYEDDENHVSIYFSKFINTNVFDIYKTLLHEDRQY